MLEKNIKIRILEKSDYSQSYLNWFSDPDIVKFSENRKKVFSKESQIEYIKSFENKKTKFLYGIFFKNIHIGNIEINPINYKFKHANISYIIGEKKFWGKGIATYSITYISQIAKNQFKLKKLYAGCASENIPSIKVLKKNGFVLVSSKKDYFFYDEKYMSLLKFSKEL